MLGTSLRSISEMKSLLSKSPSAFADHMPRGPRTLPETATADVVTGHIVATLKVEYLPF